MANKVKELQARITKLNAEVDRIKAQLRPLVRERDALLAEQETRAKLDGMSDAEKAALWQQLQAEGIGSQEAFGEIGG